MVDPKIASKNKKWFLLSGIGNPLSFEQLVEDSKLEVMGHLKLRDHFDFGQQEVNKALLQMKSSGAEGILCTEKDKVKLARLVDENKSFYFAPIELVLKGATEELHESIRKLFV